MRTSLLALIAVLSPLSAFAIDQSGPVILSRNTTVCRNPYDFIRSVELLKQDPVAWVKFTKETQADGRCFDVPAGRRLFAMERVQRPEFMECLRIEGETTCAWGFPEVMLHLSGKSPTR